MATSGRKKQSVEMYGKKWSLVDLDNLKEAVKTIQQLEYYQNNFVDSLSAQAKLADYINKKTEAEIKFKELSNKYKDIELEKLEHIKDALEIIQQTNKAISDQENTTSRIIKRADELSSSKKNNISMGNLGSTTVNKWRERDAQKLYDTYYSDYIKSGKSENNARQLAMNQAAQVLDNNAGKYEMASSLIQTAADTFSKAVSIFANLFTQGMNKQVDTYNSTFSNISVRTGTTRSGYYSAWTGLNGELSDRGLFNNIGSSEVMQMWNTLASQGMNINLNSEQGRADAIGRSIDTVLTQKIVPYLDSSNVYFQQLAGQQPNLIKQVRGIGTATMEISGSSVVANKYLQDMITNLSPVAELANQELGLQYAEVTGQLERLREMGISDNAIGEVYSQIKQIVEDPYAALQSGDLTKKLTVVRTMQTGDLRNAADVASSLLPTADWLANSTPEGRNSTLYTGAIASATGSGLSTSTLAEFNEKNVDIYSAIEAGNKAAEIAEQEGIKNTEDYKNDINQTNEELQELTMENVSNQFAMLKGFLGNWYDVIVTAINGIAGTLAAGVIGKGIGLLAGSGAGGTGAGILAGAGGIALGTIGGVAAVVAISNAIKSSYDKEEVEFGVNQAQTEIGDAFTIDDTLKNIQGVSSKESINSNNGWISNTAESISDAFGATWMGIKKLGHTLTGAKYDSNYVERNADFYKTMVAGALVDANTDKDRTGALLAYAYLLNEINSLESMDLIGSPITKDQLKQYYEGEQFEYYNVQQWVNKLIKQGYAPSGYTHNKATDANVSNYLRIGKDYVPYDDYPALLHEGEAVLTAGTANELRNLIDEYRQTSKQSINFETIIQNQTSALINKLEELRQTMEGTYTTSGTEDSTRGTISKRNFNSMINMRNTKSAFEG